MRPIIFALLFSPFSQVIAQQPVVVRAARMLDVTRGELVSPAIVVVSNGRIADSLHLSEATVKRHLADVYQKMGVSSRGEAAREALLREWITIEEITAEEDRQPDPPSTLG